MFLRELGKGIRDGGEGWRGPEIEEYSYNNGEKGGGGLQRDVSVVKKL